jgi:hypothetical protein
LTGEWAKCEGEGASRGYFAHPAGEVASLCGNEALVWAGSQVKRCKENSLEGGSHFHLWRVSSYASNHACIQREENTMKMPVLLAIAVAIATSFADSAAAGVTSGFGHGRGPIGEIEVCAEFGCTVPPISAVARSLEIAGGSTR